MVFCLAEKLSFHKHLRPGSFCQRFELPTNLPAWPSNFFYEHSQTVAISQHLTFCCLSKHRMSHVKICSGSEGKYNAEYLSGAYPHPSEISHVSPTSHPSPATLPQRYRLPFQHRTPGTTETKSPDSSTEGGNTHL